MTRWDPSAHVFVDDEREFTIETQAEYERRVAAAAAEDEGAGQGLAIGLTLGAAIWLVAAAVWLLPWTRGPLASFGAVLLIIGVVWASSRIVDRWREAHPDNPVVDWLRRTGL